MKFTENSEENYEHLRKRIAECESEEELGYIIDTMEDAFIAGYIGHYHYDKLQQQAINRDKVLYDEWLKKRQEVVCE